MLLSKERIFSFLGGVNKSAKETLTKLKISYLAFVPLVILASSPVNRIESTDLKTNNVSLSELQFSLESYNFVSSKTNVVEINPGESLAQKKIREQKEQEERQKLALASRNTLSREGRARTTAKRNNFEDIYQAAGQRYNVDPMLLKAIHFVESTFSDSSYVSSYAGAQGPMQFMPSTWRRYGVDANGDGIAEIGNVEDAIYGAANYLRACGYPNLQKALWGYNRSTPYFHKVVNLARSYGMQL